VDEDQIKAANREQKEKKTGSRPSKTQGSSAEEEKEWGPPETIARKGADDGEPINYM
jgi:hypothetical protein